MSKLNHKLSLHVLASLIVIWLLTGALVVRSERLILEEDMRHSGQTLAATIAAFCVETMLLGEYPYLETYIRKSAQNSKQVVYIRVWEVRGGGNRRLIAQHPAHQEETRLTPDGHRVFRSPVLIEAEDLPPDVLGEVEVAISTERLTALIELSGRQLFIGASAAFAVMALVIFLTLRRNVLNPIEALDRHATRIGSGDLSVKIEATSRDELGRLAATMEKMRAGLQESYSRIESQIEELKALDRMKDEFLANTSHELKTPLNGILGLTESMAGGSYGEVPPGWEKPLGMVSSCARRLTAMTDSILQFSQLARTGGEPAARPERLLLAQHLRECLDDLALAAERKGIRFVLSVPPDLEVQYCRSELEQLVRILADNAVKFTDRGFVEVIAKKWEGAAAGFQVAVRDTGPGVPEELRERIFEPFVQGFRHETRSHGGVGLGLSIATKLAVKIGGRVLVESVEGRGSSFTVLVPESPSAPAAEDQFVPWPPVSSAEAPPESAKLLLSPAAPEPAYEPAEDGADGAEGEGALPRERPHILIGDDDPVNLEVLWQVLRQNHRVTRANDGASCLEALRSGPVDILLLDIMMPRISGYDVLRAMRAEGMLERTAVIVVSAKSSPESVIRGLRMGASDYLGKPFHREELLCRIRTHLKLLEQRKQLEGEIEKRTQALQAAEHASYVKTQFLANMSHEIRTPINGILGFIDLALGDGNAETLEDQREYLENVRECTRSLMTIVNDILDVTKIESKHMHLELLECKPREILESSVQLWKAEAQRKNLVLRLDAGELGERTATTDPHRFRQILHNLIGNALKFTACGEVRVTARILAGAGGSELLEVAVADTGIGIDPSKFGEIFQPFTQADISMTRRYGGTGLGLTISRSLARMLSGDITVESELGKGSTFTLRVPMGAKEQAPLKPVAAWRRLVMKWMI
jgi:signal transduction histidine kinase